MNITIPIGGKALRFYQAGYRVYKPFIKIGDKTMIERVISNITPACKHRFLLSIRPEDHDDFIKLKLPNCRYIRDTKQFGQASGVLFLEDIIDNDEELMIANSDQIVDADINEFIEYSRGFDACIMTFPSDESKWSYAKPLNDREVEYTIEKEAISDKATVGIYYFKRGRDFITAVKAMIFARDHTNGEYYVCPTFNYLPRHKRIGYWDIPKESMHGLGTPEDYKRYLDGISQG